MTPRLVQHEMGIIYVGHCPLFVYPLSTWCSCMWPNLPGLLPLYLHTTQTNTGTNTGGGKLNLKCNKQDMSVHTLSKPICVKEERDGPPSDNQGLHVPNLRYGCAIFHPACDTAHWYSIMISTYGGITSRYTTDISYWNHWNQLLCSWQQCSPGWPASDPGAVPPCLAACHSWLWSTSEGKYQQATYIIAYWCGRSRYIYACVKGKQL